MSFIVVLTVVMAALLPGAGKVVADAIPDDDEFSPDTGALDPRQPAAPLNLLYTRPFATVEPRTAPYVTSNRIEGAGNMPPVRRDSIPRHSITPAQVGTSQICCYNLTTTPKCAAIAAGDYATCSIKYGGYMASGKCGDKPNPCDTGACCGDVKTDYCQEGGVFGLRGNCFDNAPFFKNKTCRSCRKLSLGACCSKASSTSAVTCDTNYTLTECGVGRESFIGFSWNKTCAEAKCGSRGACCSFERNYDGSTGWTCFPGALWDAASEECVAGDSDYNGITGDFVQGQLCGGVKNSCNTNTGACCYVVGLQGRTRACSDSFTRERCSKKPGYVSFHNNATCKSIGNCSTTSIGACFSPPHPDAYNQDAWPCIAGYSEAMCNERNQRDTYFFWYAQHAPGYSCNGYNSSNPVVNSILKQRGACLVLDPTTKAKKCNNNVNRTLCMGNAGFLGFNAAKTCSDPRPVYGACCYPPKREEARAAGPTCMATTEKACGALYGMTAWVRDKPCNGTDPQVCTPDIKGACCYSKKKANCEYSDDCYSSECKANVTWTACLAAQDGNPTPDGGHSSSFKFAAGANCAADTCRLAYQPE